MPLEPISGSYMFGTYIGQTILSYAFAFITYIEQWHGSVHEQNPWIAKITQPIIVVLYMAWEFVQGFSNGFVKPLLKDQKTMNLMLQAVSALLVALQSMFDQLVQSSRTSGPSGKGQYERA
ncbi:hypothetical protein MP638_004995 [Amoeboaphelidium occidentale]|nr:hypothetical protein MP638_004995 [Amoeboaphelidium occidentale]